MKPGTLNASQQNIGHIEPPLIGACSGDVHFMLFVLISLALGNQPEPSFQWNMGLTVFSFTIVLPIYLSLDNWCASSILGTMPTAEIPTEHPVVNPVRVRGKLASNEHFIIYYCIDINFRYLEHMAWSKGIMKYSLEMHEQCK